MEEKGRQEEEVKREGEKNGCCGLKEDGTKKREEEGFKRKGLT